ncbi:hypothetical protein Mapa_007025 [Marchantia paleacea]|nr:hypothetical protein Mapa_007025 [Marchantia paleacea]
MAGKLLKSFFSKHLPLRPSEKILRNTPSNRLPLTSYCNIQNNKLVRKLEFLSILSEKLCYL